MGIGAVLESLDERQYRNDAQIDNALRSVLFQVPKAGISNPAACGKPVVSPACYTGVQDLGALDVERGRDHGLPYYNDLRKAYGLPPKTSFTEITGERTDRLASNGTIGSRNAIDDRHILDFVALRDEDGRPIRMGSDAATEDAVVGLRRTTLAARLKALYGSVDRLDAFVGMVSEPHVPGSELGELQLAIWKRQFEAVRDGDRFFYAIDPALRSIERLYRIDYPLTLAEIVRSNTDAAVPDEVFKAAAEPRE